MSSPAMRTIASATAASEVCFSASRVSDSTPFRTASGVKAIANIAHRHRVARVLRICFQPIAQAGHVGVDRAVAVVLLTAGAPQRLLQFEARERLAWCASQDQEQFELSRRKVDVAAHA